MEVVEGGVEARVARVVLEALARADGVMEAAGVRVVLEKAGTAALERVARAVIMRYPYTNSH